jgi:major vault protein
MIRVIQGHHLRSNQYLVVRVYEEEAAKNNWEKAVVKPQKQSSEGASEVSSRLNPEVKMAVTLEKAFPDLTVGKLLIIKGTDVSFYIPPTGIEVVQDKNGNYVRDAVTLEHLGYCILLDEDGNKRYIQGPAVVFPEPTETFVERNGSKKFNAVELNEICGIYIKVIAAYKEDGKEYKVGDELFITGNEQMIYFPRPEHAIIRYEGQEMIYAMAIPDGEALYVLNRMSGQITLKRGPYMYLPDPRKEVIVRRALEPKQVELWFPGNQVALEYNKKLKDLTIRQKPEDFVKVNTISGDMRPIYGADDLEFKDGMFTRKRTFTPPRTVTLDTKYSGAVSIDVWTGYAVMVLSKTGTRKVVVGPQTCLLEYDETLEVLELSTGVPKTDENMIKTVYLRVLNNKVNDVIDAETNDLCRVVIHLSFRVDFEGEPEKWFNVENYTKFLTDHVRSMLRNAIKQYGIEEFYTKSIRIVRDTVLGLPNENGERSGALFTANNMRIDDVEVLNVTIGDEVISKLLFKAQHASVEQTLEVVTEKKNLETTMQKEGIKQEIAKIKAATNLLLMDLETQEVKSRLDLEMTKSKSDLQVKECKLQGELDQQDILGNIKSSELSRQKAVHDLDHLISEDRLEQRLRELQSDVDAVVSKAQAVSPQLVAALQEFSDKALAERMADSMAPLAILGGKSIAEVFSKLLKGTILENVLSEIGDQPKILTK